MDASPELLQFLRSVPILRGLTDADLVALAPALRLDTHQLDDILCHAGEPTPQELSILRAGDVNVLLPEHGDAPVKVLHSGDCFGQAALLSRAHQHAATMRAAGEVQLLVLGAENFRLLVSNYPQVKARLSNSSEARTGYRPPKRRRRWFTVRAEPPTLDWLRPGERRYVATRRHPILLIEQIYIPMGLWAAAWLAALVWMAYNPSVWQLALGALVLSLLICGPFVAWGWVEWSNDYFVVTNQRIVHVERSLGIFDTRDETLLTSIRSLNLSMPDYVARVLKMGHLTANTFAGPVEMTYLPNIEKLHRVIKKVWGRTQAAQRAAERALEREAIRNYLRPLVHPEATPAPTVIGASSEEELPPPALPAPPPSFFRRAFKIALQVISITGRVLSRLLNVSIAKMRYEEGDSVIYRKHWFLLSIKLWLPTLMLLLATGVLGLEVGGQMPKSLAPAAVYLAAFVVVLIFGFWWLYRFEDWRNDLYQVTPDTILDIHRKPLGSERRAESPLDKVLQLHSERPGLLGYLLNYGTVVAKVGGDAEFRFEDVADPQAVQDDVSRRLTELKQRRAKAEREERDTRFKEWFGVYHTEAHPPPPEAPTAL